jgi:hypothetical protein
MVLPWIRESEERQINTLKGYSHLVFCLLLSFMIYLLPVRFDQSNRHDSLGMPIDVVLASGVDLTRGSSGSDVETIVATLVRTTDTSLYDPPSPNPCGLAYMPRFDSLLIADGEVNEMPQYFTGDNVFVVSIQGVLQDTHSTIQFSDEPNGAAYNSFTGHLYYTDDNARRVWIVDPGPDGQPHTDDDIITSFSTAAFSSLDPEGIAYDRIHNRLFIVDGAAETVFIIQAGTNAIFDGVPPMGDDQVTSFDVANLGLRDPEGIEFNPDNNLLYILSGMSRLIAETTTDGKLLKYVDISGIGARVAAGLAYAPSSADPTIWSFYIVDRGVDNNMDPDANDGKLIEISFPIGEGEKPVDIYVPLLHIH